MKLVQDFEINNSRLRVVLGNLAEATTEVIVTSDDTLLSMGGGTSAAVRSVAGEAIFRESRALQPVSLGSIVVTSAGDLALRGVRHIFHAAMIPSSMDRKVNDQESVIRGATRQALTLMREMRLSSIALPALGTGFASFDRETAAAVICTEIKSEMMAAAVPITVEIWLLVRERTTLQAIDFLRHFTRFAELEHFVVPNHAVLLVHGIRTAAGWRKQVGDELAQGSGRLIGIPVGYGFFNILQFLVPIHAVRAKAAEKVWLKSQSVFSNENFDQVSVIAHSFGCWVVGYLLQHKPVTFHRVILCGAVIDADFDWDRVSRKLSAPTFRNLPATLVVNDCGTKDAWPLVAKAATWGFGYSGRWGFQHALVQDRFFPLRHSDFFKPGFAKAYWVPALVGDRLPDGSASSNEIAPSWLLSCLTFVKIPILLTVAIVGVMVVRLFR